MWIIIISIRLFIFICIWYRIFKILCYFELTYLFSFICKEKYLAWILFWLFVRWNIYFWFLFISATVQKYLFYFSSRRWILLNFFIFYILYNVSGLILFFLFRWKWIKILLFLHIFIDILSNFGLLICLLLCLCSKLCICKIYSFWIF